MEQEIPNVIADPVSEKEEFFLDRHSPLAPIVARRLVKDMEEDDLANDRYLRSESNFRPDELLSKEQCRHQEILPYTWHRFFAILQVLRQANVLDNDLNWEETVDASYYGSYRPTHFKFKAMTLRGDRTRMDNLEDLLQEAMYMKMLQQRSEDQFNYLLESIPDERLFFKRKGNYDPDLIRRCTTSFQLYRRDRVLEKVRETNPRKRRVAVEHKLTGVPVMINAEQRRVLNVLSQDSVRKSECSSGSQSAPMRGAETHSGSSVQRNMSGSKDVRGNSQDKSCSTFKTLSGKDSYESDSRSLGQKGVRSKSENKTCSASETIFRKDSYESDSSSRSISRKTVDTKLPQKRLWQEEEDELVAQEKEIRLLEKKLENKFRLEKLKATLAQDTLITPEINSYNRGR